MHRSASAAVLCWLLLPAPLPAGAPQPEVPGPEGKRAFDDLARYYADNDRPPPFGEALDALKGDDPAARGRAGKYLLALFKQSFADEGNGRAPWKQLPYFGGGSQSDARELRKRLAEAFGARAAGEAAAEATLWLLDVERLPDGNKAGLMALRRLEGPKAAAAFKHLLAAPHPNAEVLSGALAETGKRGLKQLGPQVAALCGHYRKQVREAARATAKGLGVDPVPAYDPEKAFTPALTAQLERVAAMALPAIPKDAQWVEVRGAAGKDGGETLLLTGWLLGTADRTHRLVDWFGAEVNLPAEGVKIKPITLADTAKRFRGIREAGGREAVGQLSRRGMLTAQFQPRFVSQPELLTGAWAFVRGDRKAAAEILFGRIDEMRDDRWLTDIARDLIGHTYHQEMLQAFSDRRDYARTLVLARHLAGAAFDGYQYQPRAKNLAAQLPRRAADFKTFTLPTPAEWKALQGKLPRDGQIKYLAERLRLLNCRQWGQPGGVNYEDEQNSAPFAAREGGKGVAVINPCVELGKLKLQVADLAVLVPYLADNNYMLVFSYWRDFHPGRTLHQVNWVVTGLVNDAAGRDLADLKAYNGLDEAGRKAHLAKVLAWCKANAGKGRDELLLDALKTAEDWRAFRAAAGELVAAKNLKALPILVERGKGFKGAEGEVAELCRKLDAAEAVEPARAWVKGGDAKAHFWAALILLRHGDRKKGEGLEALKAALAADDGSYLYPRAIDDLLAVKSDAAMSLACAVLKKPRFALDFNAGAILHRLFLAGRQEALDYLLTHLDSKEDAGTSSGSYKGKQVRRPQTAADRIAGEIAEWRTDDWAYESLAPEEERQAQRGKLKEWLREQFRRVRAGERPAMRTEPRPLHFAEWRLDAP
jgi:hypothetical protein